MFSAALIAAFDFFNLTGAKRLFSWVSCSSATAAPAIALRLLFSVYLCYLVWEYTFRWLQLQLVL
jgi:hypothetical protein